MDLDTVDACYIERCCGEALRYLDGVALTRVVAMDPVAEIDGPGALPTVQAAAPDDGMVAEYAVVRVASVAPIGATGVDELHAVLVAQRFEADPGQPWSEVLEAGLDRRSQRSCVVEAPEAEGEPRRDNLARKTTHRTKLPYSTGPQVV